MPPAGRATSASSTHHQQQRGILREGLHHGAIEYRLRQAVFSGVVLRKFETAVVDYVIGGGASLRAAGGLRFKRFVASLTDGYEPPSTRTILRRISKLFRIALPMISGFVNLDVAILLTLDGRTEI
jgi:hypothetical protein